MYPLIMLLAGVCDLLASGPDFQNSLLQIIFPEKIQANTRDNSKKENEQISYNIPIEGIPYIVHLKKRVFLAENFMTYWYQQGSLTSHHSYPPPQCYYQGYVEGYPISVVTLNTCSGLRGILQFENASYVIEPLESEVEFQHLLYKLRNENNNSAILTVSDQSTEQNSTDYNIFRSGKLEPAAIKLIPLYLEVHIVVDKVLYDYLGSDGMIVTSKIIEIISLINSIFAQFKVTIVLSSLELWSDKNKISTVGETDELLHSFLEWKKSYLTLRPHDIAFLFIYRDFPNYVGATFPGKMCVTNYSAGIALYTKKITLEAFSVIVTQMLGLSFGISYDDPKKCQCPGVICIMNPEAMLFSGVKTFSSCSLSDFENFISNMGAKCLQNKPQMQNLPSKSTCGNRIVEPGEVCDCGNVQQCGPNSCCEPHSCKLKRGAQCARGSCCKKDCKFQSSGYECRPRVNPECDLPEYCNGSSGDCQPDVTIHDGTACKKGKYMCFSGDCQDLDAHCEKLFGRGSKNAPFSCYEEIHSQSDRFGNCGIQKNKYVMCPWRSLICGRLICTYPTRIPFQKENISVIYAYVRDTVCVTIDYRLPQSYPDPLAVPAGSICDEGRICVNRKCVEAAFYENIAETCDALCHGNGVCTSKKECHCFPGFKPPKCESRARASSELPEKYGLITHGTFWRNPLFLFTYSVLPIIILTLIIFVLWKILKKRSSKDEYSITSDSESSSHTYDSRSRSESSNQTHVTRSGSEVSSQMDISRSKSQESTETPDGSN